VVDSVTVNTDSAIVVIANQGDAAVLPVPYNTFWVDLYVDPERMPTGVNDVWYDLADQGIAWGFTADKPIHAGETITLVLCSGSAVSGLHPVAEYTRFDGALAPGTLIAVQVDSANLDDPEYGGVPEDHEILGLAYNNIDVTLSLAGSGCGGDASALSSGDGQPSPQSGRLPTRSRNPK
jgi:hypothetical protein